MNAAIRLAMEQDIDDIREIFNYAIINTTAVYHYETYSLQMMQDWFAQKQANDFPVLVAVINNAIAGFASYGTFRPHSAYQYTVEVSVYVAPIFQQLGIAKQLYNILIPLAKEKGKHCIMAGIDAANDVSIQLHEKYGFKQVALLTEVGYKFNRWLDLVLMQLLLN